MEFRGLVPVGSLFSNPFLRGGSAFGRRTRFFRLITTEVKLKNSRTSVRFTTGIVAGAVGLQCLTQKPHAACAADDSEGKTGELGDAGDAQKPPPKGKDDNDAVARAIEGMKPLASKLGLGGALGYCSGYALKKIGKVAAFGTGCLFIIFQSAAYAGLIEIHWDELQHKAAQVADLDGDGSVGMGDLAVLWKRYLKPMLTYHLPSASGFSFGFLLGVRYG